LPQNLQGAKAPACFRAVTSVEGTMTDSFPHDYLSGAATRTINEVRGINRVEPGNQRPPRAVTELHCKR
jgi:GMP synthase PP-ATPase subunit